jgi:hypothetical protein
MKKFFGYLFGVFGVSFFSYGTLLGLSEIRGKMHPDGFPVEPLWIPVAVILGGITLLLLSDRVFNWKKKRPQNRYIKPKRQWSSYYQGHSQSLLK